MKKRSWRFLGLFLALALLLAAVAGCGNGDAIPAINPPLS